MHLALIATAAAVVAGGQFNLDCSGSVERTAVMLGASTEPFSTTYRVDLGASRWCSDSCEARSPIARIEPTRILLENKDIDTPREREQLLIVIDRRTGAYKAFAIAGTGASAVALEWTGTCDRAPFTGFPQFETKF